MYLHCRFCRYLSMCLCMYDVLPNSEDDVVTAAWDGEDDPAVCGIMVTSSTRVIGRRCCLVLPAAIATERRGKQTQAGCNGS